MLNEAVVDRAVMVALALGADVSAHSGFARKSYFYPDLPKGYQITQFREPLATGGHLDVDVGGSTRRVRIRQVHIEEDAGKSVHAGGAPEGASLVDMNRCGVPLLEIVTHPDIHDVEEADAFATELHRVLVYLGVTTGRMNEGSVRFDTNISVRPRGADWLGKQTEVKNLNSFRSVRRALEYEFDRQSRVVAEGGEVVHETLLWDKDAGRALPMRSKEVASDYRYFPEPDLVDFSVGPDRIERIRETLPELPRETRRRLASQYGIPDYDAGVLAAERERVTLYELAVSEAGRELGPGEPVAKTVSNWVMGTLAAHLNERSRSLADYDDAGLEALASRLAQVVVLRMRGDVSEPAARSLFEESVGSDEAVPDILDRLGLRGMQDDVGLAAVVADDVDAHPTEAERYRGGATTLLRFFVGQVLKRTGGRADPEAVARMVADTLDPGGET